METEDVVLRILFRILNNERAVEILSTTKEENPETLKERIDLYEHTLHFMKNDIMYYIQATKNIKVSLKI